MAGLGDLSDKSPVTSNVMSLTRPKYITRLYQG
jgi:hypothetical protein